MKEITKIQKKKSTLAVLDAAKEVSKIQKKKSNPKVLEVDLSKLEFWIFGPFAMLGVSGRLVLSFHPFSTFFVDILSCLLIADFLVFLFCFH
jgi:hypothetical protein